MSTITSPTFDAAALRRAFAEHDARALLALYADDATIERVDMAHPPSDPRILRGRNEIRADVEDVLSRDLTHEVDAVAVGPDAIGYVLRCTYADGVRVVCASTAQLRDGRIAREVCVQAWDA
jgi:ketosteroid isomerase-like protein